MVELKKLKRNKKEYYYLVHSIRSGRQVLKKQTYLGQEIPKNIEEIKLKFLREIYQEKYFEKADKIKKNFNSAYYSLPKSAREKSLYNFTTKFTYNTQKIEGSTLTLKETSNLLENGVTPSSKQMSDVVEAEAHKKIFLEMLDYSGELSLQIILKWHNDLMKGTKEDIAGKIRNHDVAISQSKFKPPKHIELNALLNEFFSWYNLERNNLHPLELAALVHLKFVTIHPFTDGNGRISRLIMNFILRKNKFPLLDIPYNKRNSYYSSLERSQTKKEDSIFLQWFFRRYIEEYKNNL